MSKINIPITLDVSKPYAIQTIHVMQGDSESRDLIVTLKDAGQVIDLSGNASAVMNGINSYGEAFSTNGTINENGTLTIPLEEWVLKDYGDIKCTISVTGQNGEVITAFPFIIEVHQTMSGFELNYTATASDLLYGKTAYSKGGKIVGTLTDDDFYGEILEASYGTGSGEMRTRVAFTPQTTIYYTKDDDPTVYAITSSGTIGLIANSLTFSVTTESGTRLHVTDENGNVLSTAGTYTFTATTYDQLINVAQVVDTTYEFQVVGTDSVIHNVSCTAGMTWGEFVASSIIGASDFGIDPNNNNVYYRNTNDYIYYDSEKTINIVSSSQIVNNHVYYVKTEEIQQGTFQVVGADSVIHNFTYNVGMTFSEFAASEIIGATDIGINPNNNYVYYIESTNELYYDSAKTIHILGSHTIAYNHVYYVGLAQSTYSVTTSVTNGSYSGSTTITSGGTASVTITPASGYTLPSTVIVSGATSVYDNSTGVITLSNATGNVTITAVCPLASSYTLSGIWTFGTTPTAPSSTITQSINFTSNSTSYSGITVSVEDEGMYYVDTQDNAVYSWWLNTWRDAAYKVVDFGSTAQSVSQAFYEWFTANANQ